MEVDTEFMVDACLKRAGGTRGRECFTVAFPQRILDSGASITHLELWAVIIALRLWGNELRGKVIRIKSDNEAVTTIVNTGKSRDLLLQDQLRELIWWSSTFGTKIKSVHWPGKINRIPDLLSRWHKGLEIKREFRMLTEDKYSFRCVNNDWFKFTHTW